jgi:hypothetical protein
VLTHAFATHAATRYIVVVEEDLEFAPDFLTLFTQLAPAMDSDSSILAISAYNDNGLDMLASSSCHVYRTSWSVRASAYCCCMLYMCVRTLPFASYYHICVLILVYMCPHTTVYVASYYLSS